jgi:predicted Zn-dependent protease
MTRMKKFLAAVILLGCVSNVAAQDAGSAPYEFILSKLAAEQGRYDEALSRIDKLVDREPSNTILLFERAMMLIDANRIDRAEAELRRVVTLDPSFYDAQRVLGRLLLDRAGNDRGKVEVAIRHLEAAFRLYGDDLSTGMMLAQIYLGTNRVAEAEKILATLVERAPDQRSINYTYAQVLTKLGRGADAKPFLERTVTLEPDFAPAILQLIEFYEKENEWLKAAELLEPLVAEEDVNLDVRRQQALYYLRAGESEKARERFDRVLRLEPGDARSQFYLADALTDLGDHTAADKIYRQLLEKTPDDTDLLLSYGLSLAAQKSFDDASKMFTRALSVPNIADNVVALANTQLAWIALQKGEHEKAVNTARTVFVFREKPNSQAINIAIEALTRDKKYKEAVALLEPLAAQFSSEAFIHARIIEMLVRSGEKEKAKAAAAAQVKAGPRNAITAAEAYIQADDYETGIAMLAAASKANPEDVDLVFQLGSAYERAGKHDQAEKTFLSILTKNPDHAASLNYLGYMWADANRNLARAAEMLERAVAQEPRNGAYLDSLGWAYFRLGKLDLAQKFLAEAASLIPRDPTIQDHLADVYAKTGDSARALETYRRALSLEPEDKLAAQLKTKIAELEKKLASVRQ